MFWRRIGALATAVVLGSGLAAAVPASPAHAAACPDPDTGVTVVVDFSGVGGGVQIGCASGSPSSGLAALQGAGFNYSFVPNQPGMVCRINDNPDPCNGAPVDAYWSYWHAPRGGSWSYSSVGAGSRTPPPGSVDGWAFGAGSRPGAAAPAAPAPPPPPPAPKPPPPQQQPAPPPPNQPPAQQPPPPGQQPPPVQPPGNGGQPGPGSDPDRAPADATEPAEAGATPSTPDGEPGGGASSPGAAAGPSPLEGSPPVPVARTSASGTGGLTGVIIAVALVAALGAAAFWVSRRRAHPPGTRTGLS